MAGPGRPSSSALARLRYFVYLPPLGGFGGDWDTLTARAPFTDEAELARILAELGHPAPPPPGRSISLDSVVVDGINLTLVVTRQAFAPEDTNIISLTLAVYVTSDDVRKARRLETWLDAHGIRMLPGSTRA